ncbi:rod shape-determining protein MreC [Candidatus Electrothrix marina]|uniref:Rod shape-determining protein MreC n=1 Tax=Candidatus Electrothrix marina TaxID=1859130 RepID=A0A3S3UDH6_9BACT|nr:rod shape-determining protein MreC [Candidatus Electrothrix marina]
MKKNSRRQGKGSIKTFRFVLFIGTVITFVLILLIIVLGDQQFGPVHKVIFEGAGPLQKAVAKISDSVHSVKKKIH